MSAANQRYNGNPQKLVVIYPAPGTGHLNPAVELGRLLVSHGLAVTIFVRGQPADNVPVAAASSTTGDASANHCLGFHCIPEVSLPSDAPEGDHVAQVFALTRASNHELHAFLRLATPAALLLDFFCGSALDVGAELGVPTYFFYPGCTASLAFLLYLPVIHRQTALSFRDLGGEFVHVPGVPPIPANDLPVAVLDRSSPSYRHFLALSEQMCKSRGVIVNSCRSLEPRATDAVVSGLCTPPGHTTPPIYCVGPLIKSEEAVEKRGEECLAWLDKQPKASVLFLCFGSMGRFNAEQITEMAAGLEMSGQRFLWVVRSPPGEEQPVEPDLDALFPEGFLHRTKGRGLVVMSWAPQREVLAHGAVGGFVTHCGWNSVLEAVMAGVPMLGWPLYAEQPMNRVFLVEEMRLAVAVKGREEGAIVTAEKIEEKVRWLMDSDGGRELWERTLAATREAKEALSDGGGSKTTLLKLVEQWNGGSKAEVTTLV